MSRFTIALLLISGMAAADETIILKRTNSYEIVTLKTGGGTTRVVVPSDRVIDLGNIPDPDPDPKTDGKTIAEVVGDGLKLVTDSKKEENGRKLGAIYRVLAEEAVKGTFNNTTEIPEAVKRLSDIVLGSDASKWASFRSHLGAHLSKLGAAGKLSTPEQVAAVFRQIAKALGADADSAKALSADKGESFLSILTLILKFLPIILELIRGFGG